ncbi:hypothetical protein [Luteimonas salinilitoris]|uniref:DUF4148 domain-containing protein n=1 Tax=Luteimonas salinilitoris TaxID=3237697 RepID=A0ABV4HT98_9GAMM
MAAITAGSAAAQQREQADYAAILGQPLVTTDAVTGEKRRLSAAEVEAAAARLGVRRTSEQKRRSAAVNRMLLRMPATYAESVAQAERAGKGTSRRTSLEEIQVTYGAIGPDGKMNATHDPDDTGRGDAR